VIHISCQCSRDWVIHISCQCSRGWVIHISCQCQHAPLLQGLHRWQTPTDSIWCVLSCHEMVDRFGNNQRRKFKCIRIKLSVCWYVESGPKISANAVIDDSVIVDFTYLYLLLMTSHDLLCVSEFVWFNNIIIFVVLFGKTTKLLLSIATWVKETKDSLIVVTCLHKDKV